MVRSTGFSSGTWTLPSHSSLYTGKSPLHHQTTRPGDVLQSSDSLLPEVARNRGYSTGLFSENPSFSSARGFGAGIDYTDESIHYKLFSTPFNPIDHVDEISPQAGISLLREIATNPHRGRNFINSLYGLYEQLRDSNVEFVHNGPRLLNHINKYTSTSTNPHLVIGNVLDAHNPHFAVPDHPAAQEECSLTQQEQFAIEAARDNRDYQLREDYIPDLTERVFGSWADVLNRQREVYKSQVRHVDSIIEEWHENINTGNTLLLVVGDHGQLFGEGGDVGHDASLHPDGVSVPFFIETPDNWGPAIAPEFATIAGIGEVLRDVVEGNVTDSENFAQLVEEESQEPGRREICADGPSWRVQEARSQGRFLDSLIDEHAVRRVGTVEDGEMTIHECAWGGNQVTEKRYCLSDGHRELLSETSDIESDYEGWLIEGGAVDGSGSVSQRLQDLGYM